MYPKISVVIPVKPGWEKLPAVESLRKVDYPADAFEVIVAEGYQPSLQRNMAVAEAKGEIIYFLDHDSEVLPDSFKKALRWYGANGVVGVGGPNVSPKAQSHLQCVFDMALGSLFGSFTGRRRFQRIGGPQRARECDVILCNLSIKRESFLKEGGFLEWLYPNEETEFFCRLTTHQNGCKFMYDPDVMVVKERAGSLGEFARTIFGYGRGRMEQMILAPTLAGNARLLPAFFLLYLGALPFYFSLWYALPALLYAGAVAANALGVGLRTRSARKGALSVAVFPAMHFAYGLGSLWGGLRKLLRLARPRRREVSVKIVKPFEEAL